MFSSSKPGAGPKDRHFVSKCTVAKPGKAMGQNGQAGQHLVDRWEGNKGFLLSVGRVGTPPNFQTLVFMRGHSSVGAEGGGEDGREGEGAAAAWPEP